MMYLYFCATFLFCCACITCTFLICSRIFFLMKMEKVEPVQNLFKTQKQRTVLKTVKREEAIQKLLDNG